jgi:hypothetical protein
MAEAAVSRWGQWLQFVEQRCKSLTLAEIAGGSIVRRRFPWVRGAITTGVFITWGGLKPERSYTEYGGIRATNLDVVKGYPAQITIVRPSNQDLSADDQWLQWRERADWAFLPRTEPAAPGLPWVENILIEDGPILDAAAFNAQFDVQALVVRAVCRERRGAV